MNDPRFLDATVEEMMTDSWAHRFREDPKLLDEIEDDDFDPDDVAELIAVRNGSLPDDFEDLT